MHPRSFGKRAMEPRSKIWQHPCDFTYLTWWMENQTLYFFSFKFENKSCRTEWEITYIKNVAFKKGLQNYEARAVADWCYPSSESSNRLSCITDACASGTSEVISSFPSVKVYIFWMENVLLYKTVTTFPKEIYDALQCISQLFLLRTIQLIQQ